jgi:DNA-binding NtrC family response regulator
VSTVATIYSDAFGGGGSGAQVVVVEGPDAGRAARIDASTRVGTDPLCALSLTDDRVSGTHLSLRPEGDGFECVDLESRNGTLYEGSKLTRAWLPLGATLKLGRSTVRIAPISRALQVEPSRSTRFGRLVGRSLAMRELFAVLELAAQSDVSVLTIGETGTGKELVARALHDEGPRRDGPFVALDCSALPEGLIESELFGHVKGAFTGATSDRRGAFQRASGGTLFLDELGTMPLNVQARLLRAVEEKRVRPVGSDREVEVHARIVAGSRDALAPLVADGRFRGDLFYRLSVLRLSIPPLRERREDIPLLVEGLLRDRGIHGSGLDQRAELRDLMAHDWPGNVRELRNLVDRSLALSPGAECFDDLRFFQVDGPAPRPGTLQVELSLPWSEAKQRVTDVFERQYLSALLAETDSNLSEAARRSGLDRKQIRILAKKHGLLED